MISEWNLEVRGLIWKILKRQETIKQHLRLNSELNRSHSYTMISRSALNFVSFSFSFFCNVIQVCPYTWDPLKYQLSRPNKYRLWIYNFHKFHQRCLFAFVWIRLFVLFTWKNEMFRTYEVHGIWLAAFSLSQVCFYQYDQKRDEIMWYGNALFDYIKKNLGKL